MKEKKKHIERGYTRTRLDFFILMAVLSTVAAVVYSFVVSGTYSNPLTALSETWIGATTVYSGLQVWKAKCESRAKYLGQTLDTVRDKTAGMTNDQMMLAQSVYDTTTRGD